MTDAQLKCSAEDVRIAYYGAIAVDSGGSSGCRDYRFTKAGARYAKSFERLAEICNGLRVAPEMFFAEAMHFVKELRPTRRPCEFENGLVLDRVTTALGSSEDAEQSWRQQIGLLRQVVQMLGVPESRALCSLNLAFYDWFRACYTDPVDLALLDRFRDGAVSEISGSPMLALFLRHTRPQAMDALRLHGRGEVRHG